MVDDIHFRGSPSPSADVVNDLHLARSRFFGEIVGIMSVSHTHRMTPVAIFEEMFFSAFRHRSYRVFYDSLGMPTGYIVWALLSEATEARILSTLDTKLHLSEWNEGDRLWIMDFIADRAAFAQIAEECMLNFPRAETAVYYRSRAGKITFKEISRDGVQRLMSHY